MTSGKSNGATDKPSESPESIPSLLGRDGKLYKRSKLAGFPRICQVCGTSFRVASKSTPGKFCSKPCRWEWMKRNPNLNWQLAGQEKMRAKFAAMTPEQRKAYCDHPPENTPELRLLNSLSKRGDLNPMKRPEVAAKVSRTTKERHGKQSSARFKQMWKDGKL